MEIALTPDSRWPATPSAVVTAAAAAGFDALTVSPEGLDDGTVATAQAAGLRCHDVLALFVGDDEDATVATAEGLAATAAATGAGWVVSVFLAPLAPGWESMIRRCTALFAEAGAGLAVEFSPLGSVGTLSQGLEVVRAAEAAGRAGLLIDPWHFFHGDSTWDDLASVPLDAIAYLQFDDALAPEAGRSPMAETLHRRALPGDGVLDLRRFAGTLLDRGWDGTVSAEVLSAELRSVEIGELTRRLYDSTARYWT